MWMKVMIAFSFCSTWNLAFLSATPQKYWPMYHLSSLVLQDRPVLNTRVQIFSECQHSHTLCTISSKLEPTGILVSGWYGFRDMWKAFQQPLMLCCYERRNSNKHIQGTGSYCIRVGVPPGHWTCDKANNKNQHQVIKVIDPVDCWHADLVITCRCHAKIWGL